MSVLITANPFGIRTALFARHVQHVVFIHFPIALFVSAVGFDFIAKWKKNQALVATVYFNLLLAAAATIPSLLTGLAAWKWALTGQALRGILLMHLVLACTSTALIWVVYLVQWRSLRYPEQPLPGYRLVIEAFAVFLVGLTAHLGGFLSGVNGPS
ncbi:MAG: DUF2231 domain-containing protein [Candidatus Acidiferrum sp.]